MFGSPSISTHLSNTEQYADSRKSPISPAGKQFEIRAHLSIKAKALAALSRGGYVFSFAVAKSPESSTLPSSTGLGRKCDDDNVEMYARYLGRLIVWNLVGFGELWPRGPCLNEN